jgi:hypothetical protein
MGFLKDAVNLGYITLDEYNDMALEWSQMGYDARHYGNVEEFQGMLQDMLDLGFLDLADAIATEMYAAIDYYEAQSDYSIFYSVASQRWHDVETGQFVRDPYSWIRD